MCNLTDCKCSLWWMELKLSGKPSAPVSPHSPTYVAIDQAPVSACHICAQTSVALIWPTVTDDHASGGWCRWWMNESVRCVTFSLFQCSNEQCGDLLNHRISTACPAVENTLLWLNKPRSLAHISHSRFISYSFFCLHLSLSYFSCCLFISPDIHKVKARLGKFRAGTAPLCYLDKNSERRVQGETFTHSVCCKGDGLPLIVILSRPAQDTGDFIPWIFICMAKQEMWSNGIECCCLSANLSAAMHPTKTSEIKVVSLLFCCCCGVKCYVKQYTTSSSENTIFR